MASVSLPPPVGGLDQRESLADMPADHAVVLDNFFPDTDRVSIRRGNSSFATGMTGNVETLIEYTPQTGTGELFAANAGKIYDVSAAGAVGVAVVTGKANDRWQYSQLGNSAGHFVRLFNGADTPLLYNGSTWVTTAIHGSGLTPANLVWTNTHQNRMWFGEKDSLSAWYLATSSVSGSATEFPLKGVAKLGGYIMAMGTWTRDAGDGMDDVACFLTSEGEVIVYTGTDPSATATWSLIGNFHIGRPIGRRCMVQAGTDLILITQDGFVPLSRILTMDRSQSRMVALSDQISSAVTTAVREFGTIYGWQPILYPKASMLIFNIPQSVIKSHQFVFNTITGSPCRFTGINAVCWGLMDDNAYWGGADGVVYKFDDGNSDNGANIEADAIQAFNYFGSPASNKIFTQLEPIFESDSNPNAAVEINVDFKILQTLAVPQASSADAGAWDSAVWDASVWGSDGDIYDGWRGVRGRGRAGSVRVRINTNSARPSWIATNVNFTRGGGF